MSEAPPSTLRTHPDNPSRSSERRVRCLHRLRRTGSPGTPASTTEAPRSPPIQQHDAVILGQSEGEVERVNGLLQVLNGLVADVLACPELEIDQAVIGVVVWIRV